MSIIGKMLKQTVVYWAPLSNDRTGKPTWDDPVELRARWEDVEVSKKGPDGEVKVFSTTVYVASDVVIGGMLLLGELTTATDPDPLTHAGAHEIKQFEKLPNFKALEFLRTAYL